MLAAATIESADDRPAVGPSRPSAARVPSCSRPSRTLRAAVRRPSVVLDRRCARRHVRGAGRDDGMAVLIEQQDDCLDWSAVLGELEWRPAFAWFRTGACRWRRHGRRRDGVRIAHAGGPATGRCREPRLCHVDHRSVRTRRAPLRVSRCGGISTVSGRRCAGSVVVSGGLVMTWRRGAGGSVARCGRGLP